MKRTWALLLKCKGWQGRANIGTVKSTRQIKGQQSTEIRYFIPSPSSGAKQFAHAARSHWGVENQLY
jgi:predicted transposase YbfD/YdcC